MRRSNFALRVQKSLLEEARKLAEAEGVALNQFIIVALAEKLAAKRTAAYFRERGSRGNVQKAPKILRRREKNDPPLPGDEWPDTEKWFAAMDRLGGDPLLKNGRKQPRIRVARKAKRRRAAALHKLR